MSLTLSSLGFGVLLLLRAVLTQSAPHIYPDEDEEALIDKLASLAVAARPDLFNKEVFSNFDISQLDYLRGSRPAEPETLSKAALENLPRQFGYTPDDVRFFIPAEQFPNYYSGSAHNNLNNNNNARTEYDGNLKNMNVREYEPEDLNQLPNDIVPGAIIGTPKEPFSVDHAPHMKKSQPESDEAKDDFSSEPDPIHSNVMASSNTADHSGDPSISHLADGSPFTFYYIALIAGGSAAGVIMIVAAGLCWYRINERVKAAAEVDYPAYGVTGPSKDVSPTGGDRKLAQSAHMYHYQHQKQQMAALQKTTLQGDQRQGSAGSDVESEDDDEEGDYTVYECPGLAPAGDMEVKNPLYDEPTPATPQPAAKPEDPPTDE